MKVSAGRVDSFVANPDPSIIAYLVYGPNPGLALERAQRLILTVVEDPNDPFLVNELSPSAISDTPSRLADELLAISFGGGERLVVVRDAPDTLSGPLKDALDAVADAGATARLVIEAGNLSGRSALRKLCESRDDCAALPCYPDDEENRTRVIQTMMRESNVRIGPNALRTL
ncbi:MAG: DNA polymerase III subunit delta, partial [Alphaproteobacteria bacterium]